MIKKTSVRETAEFTRAFNDAYDQVMAHKTGFGQSVSGYIKYLELRHRKKHGTLSTFLHNCIVIDSEEYGVSITGQKHND